MIVPSQPQASADVARHYDQLDRFYREVWGDHVHHGYWRTGQETPGEAVEQLVDFLAQELQLQPGQTVCDIGCGYGASARLINSKYGAKVTGVTLSQAQLDHGREQIAPGAAVDLQCTNWLENAFVSESFDAAYAIESTEHMHDKQRFFGEANRTLKPGGRLGVYVWLSRQSPSKWQVRHLLEPICREGRLAGMCTSGEYSEMANSAGFEVTGWHDLSDKVSKTWTICIRRFLGKAVSDRSYLRYLFDRSQQERIFALTILRILAAYRSGAMKYGLLIAQKA